MSRRELREKLRGVKPTLADRVVGYFNPVRGAERLQARMAMAIAGAYVGGSRSKRSLSAWKPGGGSADADLLPDLPALRERSRDQVRNSPLAAGAISSVTTHVVGTGLMPKFEPRREILGWDEARAAQWAERAGQEFAFWGESADCDAERTQNFYGLQDLALRSALENGDVFSLLPMIERPGARYRLAVQLVEADRVSNPGRRADTAQLAGGIEVDAWGAALRYHITTRHPGDPMAGALQWTPYPAFGAASGRRNVLHLYGKRRIGQKRGAPYLTPVIETIKQLDRYSEAEIFAAVANAVFAIKVKSPDKSGLSPLESAVTGATPGDSGDARESGWDGTLTPGLVVDLGPDEDVSSVNPSRPNAQYDPFFTAMVRLIGVGLELPFEVLIKHFTASYSAARSALLEAWKFYMGRRAWLAAGFCQPIAEEWLAEAVARGYIDAPGFFSDPLLRYAYSYACWYGDGPGSIDPLKEAEAAGKRMEIHLTTLDEEVAGYSGGDAKGKIEQAGREKAMKDKAGLVPAPAPAKAKGTMDPGGAQDHGDMEDETEGQPRHGAINVHVDARLGGRSKRSVKWITDADGKVIGATETETTLPTEETVLEIEP